MFLRYVIFLETTKNTFCFFRIIRPKLCVNYINCPGKLDWGILEMHCDSNDVPINAETWQRSRLTERPLTDVSLKHRQETLPLWSQRPLENAFIEKAKNRALIKKHNLRQRTTRGCISCWCQILTCLQCHLIWLLGSPGPAGRENTSQHPGFPLIL